jgi:hypothetical protein
MTWMQGTRDAACPRGAGDVIRSKDEQSAFHTLLPGHPRKTSRKAPAQRRRTTIFRRVAVCQPWVDCRTQKSALKTDILPLSAHNFFKKM